MIHCPLVSIDSTGRLPAPEYVRMNDNNMLVWGRPPCVTNSSSNTYSIEVFHTLELTYTIYFTHVSNGATVIDITVSTTFYDLSLATMLEPCSEYHIDVCAHNTEIELVGERSLPVLYTHRMQGIDNEYQCINSSCKKIFSPPCSHFTKTSCIINHH